MCFVSFLGVLGMIMENFGFWKLEENLLNRKDIRYNIWGIFEWNMG